MMGRRERGQGQFFYVFDLDKVVPPDHLVRQIDGVLDLDWVHKDLAPYYSHTGRPSIDPVLMIRMLIVGYVFAIRSERQLLRSAGQSGLSLVLQTRHRGRDTRSFGVQPCPA
jgi:transposase